MQSSWERSVKSSAQNRNWELCILAMGEVWDVWKRKLFVISEPV